VEITWTSLETRELGAVYVGCEGEALGVAGAGRSCSSMSEQQLVPLLKQDESELAAWST
jgi:hypothetical protein